MSYRIIIDKESSVLTNEENLVENDTNKYNSTIICSLKVIGSARDDRDINSGNYKEEVYITHINSTNYNMCCSHIHDVNVVCKFYAPFLLFIIR